MVVSPPWPMSAVQTCGLSCLLLVSLRSLLMKLIWHHGISGADGIQSSYLAVATNLRFQTMAPGVLPFWKRIVAWLPLISIQYAPLNSIGTLPRFLLRLLQCVARSDSIQEGGLLGSQAVAKDYQSRSVNVIAMSQVWEDVFLNRSNKPYWISVWHDSLGQGKSLLDLTQPSQTLLYSPARDARGSRHNYWLYWSKVIPHDFAYSLVWTMYSLTKFNMDIVDTYLDIPYVQVSLDGPMKELWHS